MNKFCACYNYILIDADQLYRIGIRSITMEDIINFKKTIIYIGKGKKERRNIHISEAIFTGRKIEQK